MVGTSNTICIDAEGSYAVLYISNKQRVTCSSNLCHYNKLACKHIEQLLAVINSCISSQEDIPSPLLPFATLLRSKFEDIVPTSLSASICQSSHRSRKNIPFSVPGWLSHVLRLSYADRFGIVDGVAQLTPATTFSNCSVCSQSAWNVTLHYHATIVTFNQLFKAKGVKCCVFITFIVYVASLPLIVFKLKCSTPDCAGEVLYEGQEHGLLSNGQHLFTYELLRRFMFQFLMGK